MDVCLVAGARPDFVKVAPIVRAINKAKAGGDDISYKLVYMGAEGDHTLEQSLYCDLGMPAPDVFLGIECDNLNELAGLSMAKFDAYLSESHTDLVLVVDDLASTMAVAIATKKRGILLAHIVAGTRSFDMSMPKEINRLVIDGLSDFLFTADSNSSSIATREGAQLSHIYMVGNVLVDSLRYNCNRLEKPELFGQLGMGEGDYIVFTVNRKAVLGDAKLLEGIAQTVQAAAGADHVVHNQNPLAIHIFQILFVQHQTLLGSRGDGLILHDHRFRHVKLGTFTGRNIALAALPAHLVGQRNALCLGGDDDVKLGALFEQLGGTGNGEFHVAEHDKRRNGQLIVYLADRQLPCQTGDIEGINILHEDTLLFLQSYSTKAVRGKISPEARPGCALPAHGNADGPHSGRRRDRSW